MEKADQDFIFEELERDLQNAFENFAKKISERMLKDPVLFDTLIAAFLNSFVNCAYSCPNPPTGNELLLSLALLISKKEQERKEDNEMISKVKNFLRQVVRNDPRSS